MARPERSHADQAADEGAPPEAAVRAQLERIVGSADFAQSERMKSFLRFVVEETLAGRGERLKEYTIATDVFGRDESFDPQTNTVVRVEAGRLRRRIERFYLTEGREDAVRIDLPKGSYVPIFRAVRPEVAAQPPRQMPTGQLPETDDVVLDLPKGPSIAVLPFENLSDDPSQQFFAEGISEEIINDLTRFPNLKVVSRYTTFKYKGRHVDVRDVGKDLGVSYVVEGSVRKAGDMVRVTSQLVQAGDGTHLFSDSYDRDLSAQNILEIQDDIADRIVAAVGQPYGVMARAGARLAKAKALQHLDAYDAVLRFYEYWVNASAEQYEPVRAALQRAVKLDPGYASAWAALASMHLDEVRFGFGSNKDNAALDRALEAAQRAVRLDPENSMAYHFLFSTHFHRGEIEDFKATGERAVALNPNHADMLADFGVMLCCIGDWDRGLGFAEKAIALSPTHPGWFHAAALFDHYRKGEFEAALAEAREFQAPEFFLSYVFLGMCYGQLGQEREGRAACDKLLERDPAFLENVWGYLRAWNLADDLALLMVDGLRKAGLRVPERGS